MSKAFEKFDLHGKTALVTGGATGIGLEMTRGLALAGATVVIAARREAVLKQAVDDLMADPEIDRVLWHSVDLEESDSVDRLAEFIDRELGGLDILVGNAGTDASEFIGAITRSEAERVLRVNLTSNIMLTNRFLPGMRAKKWGRIIFSSSICGVVATANEGVSVYGASKAGLDGFVKYVAAEAGPDNITANSLTIGACQTEMMQEYADDAVDTFVKGYLSMTSLGRMGKPSDMAGIVQLLASEAGAYITGTSIPVDGGLVSTLRPNLNMTLVR